MVQQSNGFVFKENKNVHRLLTYIGDKGFTLDERLPSERELAEQLGIGRNSLREALKVLNAMGIIDILPGSGMYLSRDTAGIFTLPFSWTFRPGSGIFLRKLDVEPRDDSGMWLMIHKDEILHMITVRETLDLKAIDLIPEERYLSIRQELRECVAQVRRTHCTIQVTRQQDLAFHDISRRASGNDILMNICVLLTGTIYDERKVLFSRREYVERSLWEHMQIANAFGSGDVNQIKQAYIAHLASTRLNIESVVQEN